MPLFSLSSQVSPTGFLLATSGREGWVGRAFPALQPWRPGVAGRQAGAGLGPQDGGLGRREAADGEERMHAGTFLPQSTVAP